VDTSALRAAILRLVADPSDLRGEGGRPVDETIAALDEGRLRVCEPVRGSWHTHAWIKEAILLYFRRRESIEMGAHGYDKIPLKTNYEASGVRCVPPGAARYGSYLGRGTILMPGYVNIGAYVDEGCMVDTWATVGSCAQIGKNVHLSGGVGIGGVLEPLQATPVVIEDGAFIGSRCVIVEGVHVESEAVLGAGVVLTASTPILDVRGSQHTQAKGRVPARAVVIPGTIQKTFPAGTYGVPCALLIGERSASTDRKTSLNAALREFEVAV
jgi:2,3,4,5-tetrahydropyridine-2-carboxylate N-succinyltransferase